MFGLLAGLKFIPWKIKGIDARSFFLFALALGCILVVNLERDVEVLRSSGSALSVLSSVGLTPLDERYFEAIIGIPEEILFRMTLCSLGDSFGGPFWAVLISASLWDLFHEIVYGYSIGSMVLIFLIGLCLGGIYLYNKDPVSTMLAHFVGNFIAF
jgi:membrane protease YdiL (CAAX protease family)